MHASSRLPMGNDQPLISQAWLDVGYLIFAFFCCFHSPAQLVATMAFAVTACAHPAAHAPVTPLAASPLHLDVSQTASCLPWEDFAACCLVHITNLTAHARSDPKVWIVPAPQYDTAQQQQSADQQPADGCVRAVSHSGSGSMKTLESLAARAARPRLSL